ncbi:MAG: dienelactone hydrolase family protein [Ignavibacteriota bacterium]
MNIYKLIIVIIVLLITQRGMTQIHTENIEYKDGDYVLEGYIAYDESFTGERPGVLVVHDWMGVGEYSKMRCEMLAKLGYFAFAADIYGKGVRPTSPEEAGKQAGKYKGDRNLFRSRVNAALDEMKKQKLVNKSKIAAIGYCFGGTGVLELGRSGADIKGIISFHGNLDTPTPNDAKNIKARILICHGGADKFVPAEQVKAFDDEMKNANINYKFISYEGAVHSFTNPFSGNDPSKGAAYNEKADKDSWEDMKSFFAEIF